MPMDDLDQDELDPPKKRKYCLNALLGALRGGLEIKDMGVLKNFGKFPFQWAQKLNYFVKKWLR